jgi:methylation protein EvaC
MNTLPICAFCDSSDLTLIIDFGDVALAGGFLKKESFEKEQKYPQKLYLCNHCMALQITEKVPPEILFQDYFYFSSAIGTLQKHFRSYASEVVERFRHSEQFSVLEFGCNDGVLLKPIADLGVPTIVGVDPATNVVASISDNRISIINTFFDEDCASKVVEKYGKIDLVCANNVYAHIEDIQGTTRAIKRVLGGDGVFVFEVHYLGCVLDGLQYDMIYHEHLYYYSLISARNHFKRYGMTVFDVKMVDIHAGSVRFYVCKDDSKYAGAIAPSVGELLEQELAKGYDDPASYAFFSSAVSDKRKELMALLTNLKKQGKVIAGYGASGRANTMIQYCGIDGTLLDYMIDDAPAKQGFYTPGSHLLIKSPDCLKTKERPDYLLVFAWSFLEEIKGRNSAFLSDGGYMISPLPTVNVIQDYS